MVLGGHVYCWEWGLVCLVSLRVDLYHCVLNGSCVAGLWSRVDRCGLVLLGGGSYFAGGKKLFLVLLGWVLYCSE